jgi:hypothetical protein
MQQINVVLPVAGPRPANEISIRGGSRPRYTAVGATAMFHSHIPDLQLRVPRASGLAPVALKLLALERRNKLIFSRRLWANRIIKKAGFPVRSREARLLIDLLMRASKKHSMGLPTAEQVLFSALRMFHDKTAVAKVADELAISPLAAERALAKLPTAAIALASENRMRQFVEVANRIHMP